jgi:hypothetical protein
MGKVALWTTSGTDTTILLGFFLSRFDYKIMNTTSTTSEVTPTLHSAHAFPKGFFRKDCRLCHSADMKTFLDFGMHPHSDGFVAAENIDDAEPFFPLAVDLCLDCGQVQIHYVVSPDYLYGNEYLYDSTITQTGRTHFGKMAQSIVETYHIPTGSLAIDIGSNVGLLLSGFRDQGMRVQGVDPTPRMTAIAIENGIDTITECFSSDVARRIVAKKGKAAVITGTNVFAHIDDLDDVMVGIDILLEDKGVFVIEAPYLADMLDKTEYDTIYHQHLSYLSVAPLSRFFARFGMVIANVEHTSIHGGSIRIFIAHQNAFDVHPVVLDMIQQEQQQKLHSLERMHRFANDVYKQRADLITMLVNLKNEGASIAAIGAPAKGSTLLNFCGITSALIDFTTEKNTLKVGRFTPGTHLPIITDEMLIELQPDYALILPWNFAPEIMKNLQAYKDKGGRFIVPIPSPHIL